MSASNRPDRAYVEAVAREETALSGLTLDQVLHGCSIVATQARRRAFRRIKRETACSTFGLAAVFGCDHGAVLDALREPEPQRRKPAPTGFREITLPDGQLEAALVCLAAIDRITGVP